MGKMHTAPLLMQSVVSESAPVMAHYTSEFRPNEQVLSMAFIELSQAGLQESEWKETRCSCLKEASR